MDKITTTIKREWLREIAAGRKRVEYREIKPYWTPVVPRRYPVFAPTNKWDGDEDTRAHGDRATHSKELAFWSL